jgi:hypothetical protein
MADQKVDIKVLETKMDKGEKLTEAEERYLQETQPPPADFGGRPRPEVESTEAPAGKTPEEEKAIADKAESDRKAAEALQVRAKAVGLPDTATEEEVKAVETKSAPVEDTKIDMLKLEEMLSKPEGGENFVGWSKREQAYYWRMRREQKRATKAEEDRDAALFTLSKIKKEEPAKEPKKEEEDPLKGKDPTDFITVADVQKILSVKPKDAAPTGQLDISSPIVQGYLKSCDEKAAAEKPDYADTMELTEEIINTNPAYQKQVVEALIKGDNPALKMYELIQADPEYAKLLPAAQVRVQARKKKDPVPPAAAPKAKTPEEIQKEKDAKEAEEALERNKNKPKTSGHAEGKDKIEGSDLTIEQITNMSDREFSKLPKSVRTKYLELYG